MPKLQTNSKTGDQVAVADGAAGDVRFVDDLPSSCTDNIISPSQNPDSPNSKTGTLNTQNANEFEG